MPRTELDLVSLLMKIVARQTGEISKVDYTPQKKAFSALAFPDETKLERATPESQGVSSAFFARLIRDLARDKESRIHKFMALRHGKVIAECSFEPFDMDMWHVTYSMCKSITGMAIGILIDEGRLKLTDTLQDIFGARMGLLNSLKKQVTVRNLLNMSSGVDFNEAGAISGNDWRKSFFEASFKFDPGTKFEYNSMNSYMLSAIVTEITGQTLFDFCKEKIFDPMGIKRVFWESCPQSITKGGWGLFMRIEDMAKMGQLFLQNGKWNGQQIVSRQWVVESTALQIETMDDDNPHYGYQLWISGDRKGSFAYNGMLGQNVFVYPDIDMVVVTNAGNKDVFQTSSMAQLIRKRMRSDIEVSDGPLSEDPAALSDLKAICKSVSLRTAQFPAIMRGGWQRRFVSMTTGSARRRDSSFCKKRSEGPTDLTRNENQLINTFLRRLSGNKYDIETSGVGLFPIMMQVVHNNFTDGIRSIGLRYTEDRHFYIDVYEGEVIFRLKCGFGDKRYVSDLNMHGENYKVSLRSAVTRDEYNRLVLRNDIYFLEEACLRNFNIYFEDDGRIEVRLSETPGTDMLMNAMRNVRAESSGIESTIINKLLKGGMKEALEHAVKNTVQPVIYGQLTNPSFIEPVDEEK